MRTWTTAVVELRCGRCAVRIPVDAPVLTIKLPGMHRGLTRCETCAWLPTVAEDVAAGPPADVRPEADHG